MKNESVRTDSRNGFAPFLCAWIALVSGEVVAQAPSEPRAKPTIPAGQSTVQPPTVPPRALREYQSRNLVLWTDLSTSDAEQAVQRLERTVAAAEKHWGRAQRGKIHCYVIGDVENVPDTELPHRLARILIGRIGGATMTKVTDGGKDVGFRSVVYASSRPGIAEHELVHAYCSQTHGYTGPNWYKEGMAEMVVLRCSRESGVVCSLEQIDQLRELPLPSVQQVLAAGNSGSQLVESLTEMLSDPKNRSRNIPSSDWKQEDTANVSLARREYLRSWAFCYLLLNNPNYASRFQMLGRNYVTTIQDDYQKFFSPVEREVAFEYDFFLQHIALGYRVDLCSWDWNKRFKPLNRDEPIASRIVAARGFQASGLSVAQGESYAYQSDGSWSTSRDKTATTADGSADHVGGLIAVVMHDYQLSESIPLGVRGTFQAPVSGNLYLRCNDAYNELSDNRGSINVRFTHP